LSAPPPLPEDDFGYYHELIRRDEIFQPDGNRGDLAN
jgi:hypothetical protein